MNDLILKLRAPVTMSMFATKTDLYMDILQSRKEAADHIEAQNDLIRDLSDCLEDMTKHYVEVRNDLYGFEATEEIEVIAAGKLIALSKSNPNTPERNDK